MFPAFRFGTLSACIRIVPSMDLGEALDAVDGLADWSSWRPFEHSAIEAPRTPGVYQFRLPATNEVVYVGMAGERRVSGGAPKGLHGRLTIYRRGRGAVSGFGEAALDRALGDIDFLEARLTELRTQGAQRAKVWAQKAIAWLAPEVRWATCRDRTEALRLEDEVEKLLGPHGLWNRVSEKARAAAKLETAENLDDSSGDQAVLTVRGFTVDLDLLYRAMFQHSAVINGQRVFNGSRKNSPGVKRLLNTLFNVPTQDTIHPVNNAVRSACRDRLAELGWATKHPGHSSSYDLHRDLTR